MKCHPSIDASHYLSMTPERLQRGLNGFSELLRAGGVTGRDLGYGIFGLALEDAILL